MYDDGVNVKIYAQTLLNSIGICSYFVIYTKCNQNRSPYFSLRAAV